MEAHSMKTLKEISEQIRAGIAQFVEEVDSSESVLDKIVIDMKKRIAAGKNLVAGAIAEEERLKQGHQAAVDAAETWAKKADAALENRDITGARAARQHKEQQMQRANDYERQILAQQAVVTSLKTTLIDFYQQFQNIVQRTETLHHHQKQAETRAKLHKLLAEIEPYLSNALKQTEQKLKKTEVEAELWEKRNRAPETQSEANTNSPNLDQALVKLKEDILGKKND